MSQRDSGGQKKDPDVFAGYLCVQRGVHVGRALTPISALLSSLDLHH